MPQSFLFRPLSRLWCSKSISPPCRLTLCASIRLAHSASHERLKVVNTLYRSNANIWPPRFSTIPDFLYAASNSSLVIHQLAREASALLRSIKADIEELPFEKRWHEAAKVDAGSLLAWALGVDKALWKDILHKDFANVLSWFLEPSSQSKLIVRLCELESERVKRKSDSYTGKKMKWDDRDNWSATLIASYFLPKFYWFPNPRVA